MQKDKLNAILKDVSLAAVVTEILAVDMELGMLDVSPCFEAAILIQTDFQEWDLAKVLMGLTMRLTDGIRELDRVMGESAKQVRAHQELYQAERRKVAELKQRLRQYGLDDATGYERDVTEHDQAREFIQARLKQLAESIDELERLEFVERMTGRLMGRMDGGPDSVF